MSRRNTPHGAGQNAFAPDPASGGEITIERMYYTLCQLCGAALNDWSDSMPKARRNRREHLEWHRRNATTGEKD